jgi:hypothetical protein
VSGLENPMGMINPMPGNPEIRSMNNSAGNPAGKHR